MVYISNVLEKIQNQHLLTIFKGVMPIIAYENGKAMEICSVSTLKTTFLD